MIQTKGMNKVLFFLMFIPIFISIVSAEGLDVAYNRNLPKVVMNISSSSLTCQCSPANVTVNVTGGLPIWINDSNGQIVINQTYTGDVNITGRNLYLPQGTQAYNNLNDSWSRQIDGVSFVNQIQPILYSGYYPVIDLDTSNGGQLWFNSPPTSTGSYSEGIYWGSPFTGTSSSILFTQMGGSEFYNTGNLPFNFNNRLIVTGNISSSSHLIGNGTYLTGVCHNATQSGCGDGSSGNPFNQELNTSYGATFRNLTINGSALTDLPLTIFSGVNSSVADRAVITIRDNQTFTTLNASSNGVFTVSYPQLSRSIKLDPANGALDSVGSSLNMNRFTTRNVVMGGTGGGGGTSASLLVGTGSGNTNFGSERAKLSVGTNDNSSIIAAFRGGGGQTKSVIAIVNLTEFQVFNVSSRGEVQASNVTIREILQLYPLTLPTCAGINNGSIARNISDNKPYWCNGTAWGSLL